MAFSLSFLKGKNKSRAKDFWNIYLLNSFRSDPIGTLSSLDLSALDK